MNRVKIPHNGLVFVGDGRKALFLSNEGDEVYPNLKVERVFEDVNPPSHEQGTERPGRISKAISSGQRGAVDAADWHVIEEHHFVKRVAAEMERLVRDNKVPAVVIVAPPRTLADLRDAIHTDTRAHVIAEINKDLTRHSVGDIEQHLTAA
jgi:protein required for attachment to host cells